MYLKKVLFFSFLLLLIPLVSGINPATIGPDTIIQTFGEDGFAISIEFQSQALADLVIIDTGYIYINNFRRNGNDYISLNITRQGSDYLETDLPYFSNSTPVRKIITSNLLDNASSVSIINIQVGSCDLGEVTYEGEPIDYLCSNGRLTSNLLNIPNGDSELLLSFVSSPETDAACINSISIFTTAIPWLTIVLVLGFAIIILGGFLSKKNDSDSPTVSDMSESRSQSSSLVLSPGFIVSIIFVAVILILGVFIISELPLC